MGITIADGLTGNVAGVTPDHRLKVIAETVPQAGAHAFAGTGYDFNTGVVTLTDAVETPLLYIKNTNPTDNLQIERFLFSFGIPTAGAGHGILRLYANVTAGTILAGTAVSASNRNFGIVTPAQAVSTVGATGLTFTASLIGQVFFASAVGSLSIPTEVVLPNGASALVTVQAPTGNTSLATAMLVIASFVDPDTV